MKIKKIGLGSFVMLFLAYSTFAKVDSTKNLSDIFARGYLLGAYGRLATTGKMVATDDQPYNPPMFSGTNFTVYSSSYLLGYGRSISDNFYVEISGLINYYEYNFIQRYPFRNPNAPYRAGHEPSAVSHELMLKGIYYYPLIKNRLYLSGALGAKLISMKTVLGYGVPLLDSDAWFDQWNQYHFKIGGLASIGLNLRIGKRLLIFANYSYAHLLTANAFFHYRIEYYGYNGNVQRYYETLARPYNHTIRIGIKLSLENSLFYKK